MSGKKILITGATGHVGFPTLLDVLIAGNTPRIAVRLEARKDAILKKFKEAHTQDSSYEFIVVLDIVASGAYDEAIKGVDYAIHIASPIESATLNILEVAKKEPKVKRVVITSSVYATIPFKSFTLQDVADEKVYTAWYEWAHNEDIARLHVEALNSRIPAGSYQATTDGTSGIRWEETNKIVAREFPDAAQSGSLPNSGSSMTVAVHLNASETEKTFGWKFQGYESQVSSVVGRYLELLESEKR